MTRFHRFIAPGVLVAALAFAASGAWAQSDPPAYDYINWQSVPSISPDPGTETYLRSFSETVNGTLTTNVIESFWSGGDGYMYVNVVAGNAFIGTYRYLTDPSPVPVYPPSSDWTPPSNDRFYDTIPGVPEPDAVIMTLAGLGLVAWRLKSGKAVASLSAR